MTLDATTNQFQQAKQEAIEWLKHEVATMRSGRVKPDLVESLQVEYYGTRTPLNALATVSSSDARTLVVSPYDPNSIPAIEKAITDANLGVNPAVDGEIIRLSFPSMTEEVRQQTIKLLHAKAEEARVRMRQARDDALRTLKQEKEQGTATEDDFYDGKKQLDEAIDAANDEIEQIIERKEADIKTV